MLFFFDYLPGAPYGFIDRSGRVITRRPTWGNVLLASYFSEGRSLECYLDKKTTRFIDRTGHIVFPEYFEDAQLFHEGLAAVKIRDKFGYIGRAGNFDINPQFEDAQPFHNGYAAVKTGGKWGFIDKTGIFKIEADFDKVLPFSNGIACVLIGGKVGYVNELGKFLITPRFKVGTSFSNGRAFVDNSSFVDETGHIVFSISKDPEGDLDVRILAGIPVSLFHDRYTRSEERLAAYESGPTEHVFSEGLAAIPSGQSYGYVNNFGQFVISPQFQCAYPFKEGRALVLKHGRFGYIDTSGQIIAAPQYQMAGYFSEQLAPIQSDNGKWGYIDKSGNVVIPPTFASATEFQDGLAKVGQRLPWP